LQAFVQQEGPERFGAAQQQGSFAVGAFVGDSQSCVGADPIGIARPVRPNQIVAIPFHAGQEEGAGGVVGGEHGRTIRVFQDVSGHVEHAFTETVCALGMPAERCDISPVDLRLHASELAGHEEAAVLREEEGPALYTPA
jgi:hypothetical protein